MRGTFGKSAGRLLLTAVMAIILCSLVATLAAAGGQGENKGKGPVTIEYSVWAQPYELEMEKKYLEVFATKYPNIKVNLTTAPFDAHHEKLQVRVAGANAPDVFVLSELAITAFISKGVLKDLTPLFSRDKVPVDSFIDAAISYCTSNGEPHAIRHREGTYYGLPTWNSPCTISYNMDMFKAAGVAYDENWDWEGYASTLKKLTKDTNGDGRIDQYGGPLFSGLGGAIPWAFIYPNGGTWVNEDATKSVVDSPATVEAYQYLVDLALAQKVTPAVAELPGLTYTQQFTTGKTATIWSHPWGLEAFKDAPFAWDVGLPPVRNGKRAVEFETCSIVMSKDTKNAEAAWTLIKFLGMDEDCLKIMTDYGVLPSTKNATITSPKMKKFQRAMEFGAAPDFIAQYGEMDSIIASELEAALLGQKSVKDALAAAKQKIDPLLAK
ncbi:MAG: sugar ABC transporter substrate-binding protein [Spirochaetes bacterium]|nr:sugar ABC transporter substrate-binding protein [Spirochaetota bacterium]